MSDQSPFFPTQANEKERLSELLSLEILDTERESDFDLLALVAAEICKAPFAFISFVDAERVWIKAGYGSNLEVVHRSNSYCALAIMEDGLIEIPNLRDDARTAHLPFTTESNVSMYVAAVLTTASGYHLGTLCVVDSEVRTLSTHQKDILKGLASQVMQLVQLRQHERLLKLANDVLNNSLNDLINTQKQLIQTQKMAAMGALVAGISHELNTPIGNGLTVATTLKGEVSKFSERQNTGLRRTDLQEFVTTVHTAADILVRNLARSGEMINSFKEMAIARSRWECRNFKLADLVNEVLASRAASIKISGCVPISEIPHSAILFSYPDSLAQALGQLLDNALIHGFDRGRTGSIIIRAKDLDGEKIIVEIVDTGHGISSEKLDHLFEPFFKTQFGHRWSGLGLYSTYNIITDVLCGKIELESVPTMGTRVTLTLPLNLSLQHTTHVK